jgi:pantoate--beta-alanine ligase
MRALSRRARSKGESVAFVPTMGALHAGHVSLFARARATHDRVAASVFVNPLQFGPREDFSRYPRPVARDNRLSRAAGVDWLFRPAARTLYPPGSTTRVVPGPLGSRYEGAVRPGHFTGVLTVVLKLLQIVEPDTLILGKKDAQQAALVGTMMRDLDVAARLVVAPTVRERDGLALSSRNAYLSAEERSRAAGLHRALHAGRAVARAGARDAGRIESAVRVTLRLLTRPDAIDYVALVDPTTFEPVRKLQGRALLAAAIRLGRTRLIDNVTVTR